MARQAVLTRDPPPALQLVVDEAVLYREVGGQAVLCRQLTRLFEASQWPGLEQEKVLGSIRRLGEIFA